MFLQFKTLNKMYKTLVRSLLDYCDIIYHIPPIVHHPPLGTSLNNLMEKIEKNSTPSCACCYRRLAGIEPCEALRRTGMGVSLTERRM